jgi:hypothetical protein
MVNKVSALVKQKMLATAAECNLKYSGAEQQHFPFMGKPGINVNLEDHSRPLE